MRIFCSPSMSDMGYYTFSDSSATQGNIHHITSVFSPVVASEIVRDEPPVYQMEEMPPPYEDVVVVEWKEKWLFLICLLKHLKYICKLIAYIFFHNGNTWFLVNISPKTDFCRTRVRLFWTRRGARPHNKHTTPSTTKPNTLSSYKYLQHSFILSFNYLVFGLVYHVVSSSMEREISFFFAYWIASQRQTYIIFFGAHSSQRTAKQTTYLALISSIAFKIKYSVAPIQHQCSFFIKYKRRRDCWDRTFFHQLPGQRSPNLTPKMHPICPNQTQNFKMGRIIEWSWLLVPMRESQKSRSQEPNRFKGVRQPISPSRNEIK